MVTFVVFIDIRIVFSQIVLFFVEGLKVRFETLNCLRNKDGENVKKDDQT